MNELPAGSHGRDGGAAHAHALAGCNNGLPGMGPLVRLHEVQGCGGGREAGQDEMRSTSLHFKRKVNVLSKAPLDLVKGNVFLRLRAN